MGLVAASLVASNAGFGATALTPQDFAYGMAIMPTEIAAAYRVSVPLDVYRTSVRNLADVRVFDARGLTVSHRLVSSADANPPSPRVALTLMPGAGPLVVDARSLDAGTAALLLHWPQSTADYAGGLRLEASDDLAAWRTLVVSAPIANLHANGQTLLENRIELGNLKSRYWRLTWSGAAPPFAIDGVQAQPAAASSRTSWSTLFVSGTAAEFDLGAVLPVERINLTLPAADHSYVVELQARATATDAWASVAHAGFYRWQERRNGPVAVPLTKARYWRVQFGDGTVAPKPLRLEAGFSPDEIRFLANGTPPYLLAYGSLSAPLADDAAPLPDDMTVSLAGLGPQTNLGGADRITSGLQSIGALGWRNTLIWVVVTLAFGVFTSRAVRLARNSTGRSKSR